MPRFKPQEQVAVSQREPRLNIPIQPNARRFAPKDVNLSDDPEAAWLQNWLNNRRDQHYKNVSDVPRFRRTVQGAKRDSERWVDYQIKNIGTTEYTTDRKEMSDNMRMAVNAPIYYTHPGVFSPSENKIWVHPSQDNKATEVHERTHSARPGAQIYTIERIINNERVKEKKETLKERGGSDINYWYSPSEIYPRMMELRWSGKLNPHDFIDNNALEKLKEADPKNALFQDLDDETIIQLLNEVADSGQNQESNNQLFAATNPKPTIRFRNGGVVPSPREAYENNNVYAYRPQEDTYYSNLPGVDVVAKDTRVADAVRQGTGRFLRRSLEFLEQPKQQMMGAITGTEQRPSQAWGFKDPKNFVQKAANFGMDMIIDPINALPGIGLYNLSRSAGRNATKALFRPLRKAGDNVAEMGRRRLKNNLVEPILSPLNDPFKDIDLDNILQKIRGSEINHPVYKTINKEIEKQISPENFRRAANWDKEFGSNLVENLTQLKNMSENEVINKYQIPFSLDNNLKAHIGKTEINPGGLSRLNESAVIEARLMDSGMMPQRKFTFKDTEMVLNTNQIKDAKKTRRTIQHELRHGLDVHGRYFSPEESEMFTRIMRNDDDVDTFIEEVVRKNPNMSLDEITDLRESSDYFRHNTEIASYGVTNARQALLDVGIIRKIDQTVTPQDMEKLLFLANKHPEKIENVVSPEFLRFVDPKKTKEWAELMNKSILGLTGAAALGKGNFKQQTQ